MSPQKWHPIGALVGFLVSGWTLATADTTYADAAAPEGPLALPLTVGPVSIDGVARRAVFRATNEAAEAVNAFAFEIAVRDVAARTHRYQVHGSLEPGTHGRALLQPSASREIHIELPACVEPVDVSVVVVAVMYDDDSWAGDSRTLARMKARGCGDGRSVRAACPAP